MSFLFDFFSNRTKSIIVIWLLCVVSFSGLMIFNESVEDVSAGGPTEINGVISSDTKWTLDNSPYIIKGNIPFCYYKGVY